MGTHHRAVPIIVLIAVRMGTLRMRDLGQKSGTRGRRFLEIPFG